MAARQQSRSAQTQQARRQYRMVYTEGSAAPRLEPVPKERPKQPQPKRTREQEERLRRQQSIARRNQQRALIMNRSYVLFLVTFAMVCAIFAGVFVQQRAGLTTNMNRLAAMESQLTELRAENDALEKQIVTSVSLADIKADAKQLGLAYPGSDQVVYFSVKDDDYMTRLTD